MKFNNDYLNRITRNTATHEVMYNPLNNSYNVKRIDSTYLFGRSQVWIREGFKGTEAVCWAYVSRRKASIHKREKHG